MGSYKKKPNNIIFQDGKYYLKILSKAHGNFLCEIDEGDIDKIKLHKWYITKNKVENQFYVMATVRDNESRKNILLHRFLLNPPKNMQVDHINNDGINNTRKNLRIVTAQQNQFNKLKAKGYCWEPKRNKWKVSIYLNNKNIYIGRFDLEEDARKAYLKAKAKYHGKEFMPCQEDQDV